MLKKVTPVENINYTRRKAMPDKGDIMYAVANTEYESSKTYFDKLYDFKRNHFDYHTEECVVGGRYNNSIFKHIYNTWL